MYPSFEFLDLCVSFTVSLEVRKLESAHGGGKGKCGETFGREKPVAKIKVGNSGAKGTSRDESRWTGERW